MNYKMTIRVIDFSYSSGGRRIEAVLTTPISHSQMPCVVMFPGTGRTAWELTAYANKIARHGIAVLTITQPGFGGSDGPWDFVGPRTIAAANEGVDHLRTQRFADSQRLALVGVSTGAMLAMFLAVRRDDVCAAVLASGVYDVATWFGDWSKSALHKDLVATLDAVHSETLSLVEALNLRSPIRLIANLNCPVLIWHGGKDTISPITQAYRLRDSLMEMKKPVETIFRPDAEHGRVPLKEVMPFLEKHLGIGLQG